MKIKLNPCKEETGALRPFLTAYKSLGPEKSHPFVPADGNKHARELRGSGRSVPP